jgi:hypothetical protein
MSTGSGAWLGRFRFRRRELTTLWHSCYLHLAYVDGSHFVGNAGVQSTLLAGGNWHDCVHTRGRNSPVFKGSVDACGGITHNNAPSSKITLRAECVAELGSAFLCADLELTPEVRDDHASYIASWIKVLKNDKRAIFSAASHAQRAADFLHGV